MPTPEKVYFAFTVLALILTGLTFLRPLFGLLGYTIIMMVRPGMLFPQLANVRIELVAGLVVLLSCVISGGLKHILPKGQPILKWYWLFIGVVLLSIPFAFDIIASWLWVFEFLKVVAFVVMIICAAKTPFGVKALAWTFCFTTSTSAYEAIYNYATGNVIVDRTVYAIASTGQGMGHVALANVLLQAIPLMWFMGVTGRSILGKIAGSLLAALCLAGVIVSGSRGGFIGLASFFICAILFSKRKMMLGILFSVVLAASPLLMGSSYSNYLSTLLHMDLSEGTGSDRYAGLRNGFEMMLRRPLLGVGAGCYPLARRAWMGWGLWAHNLYGELMGELGLGGLITWGMYLFLYVRDAFRIRLRVQDRGLQELLLGIFVATVVRLVLGMGTHSLYSYFWYLMGGMVIVISRLATAESAGDDSEGGAQA